MIRKAFLALSALVLLGGAAHAQLPCGTDVKYRELLKEHPELQQYEQQFEAQMKTALKTTLSPTDTTVFDVPLVIHIVHDYGAENLSDNDIYEAVDHYTEVFMMRNADTASVIDPFKKYIGNARIRFHLATKDPFGRPTKGVLRHFSYLTTSGSDRAKFEAWPNNKYINIWFIRTFGASSAGAAAYAYYPSTGATIPFYDGVISLATYFDTDKTIVHELGHVLNLAHTWGSTNNPGVSCGDDFVDDTPPTEGHSPVGCVPSALYDGTCASGYFKRYTSISGADSIVDYPDTTNAQNIMDYTYCSRMFTKGQCVRMRNALTSSVAGRNNLFTASNLASTGALAIDRDIPPVAEFSVERGVGGVVTDPRTSFITINNPVSLSFRNRSWNDTISSIAWRFSNGATIPTSTSTTVVQNRFSVPGWVTIALTATSNAGTDSIVDTRAVYAADTTAILPSMAVQYFSGPSSVDQWPMINYYKNNFRWQYYDGDGYGGGKGCVRYRGLDTTNKRTGNAFGDYDDFFTPAFNIAGITGDYYLNFYSSGARTSARRSGNGDSLQIDVSTNGGAMWTKIAGWSANSLANTGVNGGDFLPSTTSGWVPRSVRIPEAFRTGNTFFRFRYRPDDNSNNFYIDNFSLYGFPAGVEEFTLPTLKFAVYPNPSTNGCTLNINASQADVVRYEIRDVTGKLVYTKSIDVQPGVSSIEEISRSLTPNAGIYLISVVSSEGTSTQKMVIY